MEGLRKDRSGTVECCESLIVDFSAITDYGYHDTGTIIKRPGPWLPGVTRAREDRYIRLQIQRNGADRITTSAAFFLKPETGTYAGTILKASLG